MGPDGKPVRDAPVYHVGVLPNQIREMKEGKKSRLPWKEDDDEIDKFKKLVEAASNISGRSQSSRQS